MKCFNHVPLFLAFGLSLTLTSQSWSSEDVKPVVTKQKEGKKTQASQAEPGSDRRGAFERPKEKKELKRVDLHKKFPGSEATPYALGMAGAIKGESMEEYNKRMGGKEPSKVGKPLPQTPEEAGGYPIIDGQALSASEKKIWDVRDIGELRAMGVKITSMVPQDKIAKGSPMWNWNITNYDPDVMPDGINKGKTDLIKAWRYLKKQGLLPNPL